MNLRNLLIITVSLIGMSAYAMQRPETQPTDKLITRITNETGEAVILTPMINPLEISMGGHAGAVGYYEYTSYLIPSVDEGPSYPLRLINLSQKVLGFRNANELVVLVGKNAPKIIDLSDIASGENELIIDTEGNVSLKKI